MAVCFNSSQNCRRAHAFFRAVLAKCDQTGKGQITWRKQIKLHCQLLLSPDGAASSQSNAHTTTCTSLKLSLSLKLISQSIQTWGIPDSFKQPTSCTGLAKTTLNRWIALHLMKGKGWTTFDSHAYLLLKEALLYWVYWVPKPILTSII